MNSLKLEKVSYFEFSRLWILNENLLKDIWKYLKKIYLYTSLFINVNIKIVIY